MGAILDGLSRILGMFPAARSEQRKDAGRVNIDEILGRPRTSCKAYALQRSRPPCTRRWDVRTREDSGHTISIVDGVSDDSGRGYAGLQSEALPGDDI